MQYLGQNYSPKNHSLFIWTSNLPWCPIFYLATLVRWSLKGEPWPGPWLFPWNLFRADTWAACLSLTPRSLSIWTPMPFSCKKRICWPWNPKPVDMQAKVLSVNYSVSILSISFPAVWSSTALCVWYIAQPTSHKELGAQMGVWVRAMRSTGHIHRGSTESSGPRGEEGSGTCW